MKVYRFKNNIVNNYPKLTKTITCIVMYTVEVDYAHFSILLLLVIIRFLNDFTTTPRVFLSVFIEGCYLPHTKRTSHY